MNLPSPRRTFKAQDQVFSLCFSGDGRWLGLTSVGGVEVWDAAGKKRVARRDPPDDAYPYEKFLISSVTGADLFAIAYRGVPELIDAATLRSVAALSPAQTRSRLHAVTALAPLPDGRLVSGHANGVARIWSPESGKADRRVFDAGAGGPKWSREIRHLAVLPGGNGLVTLHDNGGFVRIWDIPTRQCLRGLANASGWIFVLDGSGEALVTTDGGFASAHRLLDGTEFARFSLGRARAPGGMKEQLGLALAEGRLFVCNGSRQLSSFDLSGAEWPAVAPASASQAGCLAFSPDRRTLASVNGMGEIELRDV